MLQPSLGYVSEQEAEEMKYDADYAPTLPPEDIERILALPRVLQLALPFLFSDQEIEAHRLLCMYTHEEGEAHFRSLDKTGRVLEGGLHSRRVTSVDHEDPLRRESTQTPSNKSFGAQQKTAALLDIVLRERRLARLRSMQAIELSEDEARYLVLDRLLHPELNFAPQTSDKDADDDARALELLEEAHTSAGMDATVGLNQGDEYVHQRKMYEQGATDVELHFATKWFPYRINGEAHTRESLLELVDAVPPLAFEPDEEVRLLLEEFYVDGRVDTHGRRKKGAQKQLDKQFNRIAQDRFNRKQRDLTDFPEESSLESRRSRGSFDDDGTLEDELVGGDPLQNVAIARAERFGSDDDESTVTIAKPPVTVVESVEKLNELRPKPKDPQAVLFEYEGKRASLLDENESLETRESRTHRFVVPEETDRKFLSLTITVVYRGVFTARGYRLGRIAATLFRLPKKGQLSPPIPIGYAPYSSQQLNTGTTFGKTVLVHDPSEKPLKSGVYNVVLGAASATKYNPNFRRDDLLYELTWEDKQLAMRSRLDALDRELHDAHATNKEYMEVKALHGYATMMWTNNVSAAVRTWPFNLSRGDGVFTRPRRRDAPSPRRRRRGRVRVRQSLDGIVHTQARRALEREHNRYVAMVVASDIVDDALEWMLEGWHFGERESRYSVAGYVPSLKSDGFVRAGSDQVLAQADAEDRAAKRTNEQRDEAVTGSPRTKAEKIERNAQFRLGTEKVAKDGNDHEKHLDFTETTLKFGLFCITLMFFRAMSLVRRERDTFAGTHDAITSEGNPQKPTEERRKMRREKALLEERQKKMQHVLNRAKVGEERTRKRLAKERAEAASKLHEKVRREKRELQACAKLQAFYRGHLGRKAARRWAVKRAELEAMNALMTASAITIERVFRGYMGRIAASVARMEMAEFISMIRLEEAQADEDEYWRTHGWARLKRNVMMFVRATFERKADVAEEDMKMIQSLTAAMDED